MYFDKYIIERFKMSIGRSIFTVAAMIIGLCSVIFFPDRGVVEAVYCVLGWGFIGFIFYPFLEYEKIIDVEFEEITNERGDEMSGDRKRTLGDKGV